MMSSMTLEGMRRDLERSVDEWVHRLNNLPPGGIGSLLNEAIDTTIEVSPQTMEPIGFSILVSSGGPNIEIIYHRGYAEVVGTWGGVEVRKPFSTRVADEILDYLAETRGAHSRKHRRGITY